MTAPNELRLLPWLGPDSKPCYLSTDDRGGYVSRLADNIETVQLGSAEELMKEAFELVDNRDANLDDLRHLAQDLASALRDVLRVAASRGHLLAASECRRI
ncbi:hypothetical protein [[Kitasatospora] papulosa]|uniref:hypothetical protein n=1 Tax=[Kitasatospora] papulosa TaxID=1464011 RepID=UPI0037244FB5